jgi:branched-chain amino acid transport system permease protein
MEKALDMKTSRIGRSSVKWMIATALLAGVPLLTNSYTQYVINLVFVYILLVFGLNVILGYCGQFSFAHPAFYGMGAYTCGYLMNNFGVPYWFSLPIGGVAGALGAFILSFPARRLERYWLAIITMSFAEIMVWVFEHSTPITGGVNGMIIRRPSLLGYAINTDQRVYYVNLVVCILMMIVGYRIIQSKVGRALVSIREGALAAQCLGVSLSKYKVMAYVISGLYAGIAGGLLVINLELITPHAFNLYQGGIMFAMVMIGGIGTIVGSIAGATLLTMLPEILRESQAYQELIYGFLLLFILIFMPKGLEGSLRKMRVFAKETLHIH